MENKKELNDIKILAITGPTCAGKTTLVNMLKYLENFRVVKQITTRKQREDDNRNEIVCITHEEFKRLKEDGNFYIWSGDSEEIKEENGNFYGILSSDIEKMCKESDKLVMYISYKDIGQLIEKKDRLNIKIVNLKIYDMDKVMYARMYRNKIRAGMDKNEFERRVICAKEYEEKYGEATKEHTSIIITDNLTPEEVLVKVKKIID